MTDRRRRAASSDSTSREDNPFAPPPEGQPDQPWEPRRASRNGGSGSGSDSGQGSGSGSDAGSGSGSDAGSGSGSGSDSDGEGKPSRWGSQWSSRQPGRQSGGFGGRPGNGGPGGPGNNGGPDGNGGGQGGPGGQRGMRWDPTDPLQRHARYALHAGIWGLFFALLSLPQVAMLLGALSLYWGISALRGKLPKSASTSGSSSGSGSGSRRLKGKSSRATAEDVAGTDRSREGSTEAAEPEPGNKPQIPLAVTPAQAAKAKKTAAIGGIVTAGLTLALVAATFTFQYVYEDYYTCQEDALTQSSRADCKNHLPEQLRPFLENRG